MTKQRHFPTIFRMLSVATATRFSRTTRFASPWRYLSAGAEQRPAEHEEFLRTIAKVEPPKRLGALIELLSLKGEELVAPNVRKGLNPFLVPVSRRNTDGSLLCYIRWPTQREEMPLQLVRTTEAGVRLAALSTDHYCHRLAVEAEVEGVAHASRSAALVHDLFKAGDAQKFHQTSKFPSNTDVEKRLNTDRFLLLKVGSFADCYERLAENFRVQGNDVSALVTCERSISQFYSWGHPMHFHSKMLRQLGRDKEVMESARAAMAVPKWTLGDSKEDLDDALRMAGYKNTALVGEMHAFRATDPREKDIAEGHNPIQIILDQAAHLMDAVALGSYPGGWDAARPEIAKRYRDAGYPEMAAFIESA